MRRYSWDTTNNKKTKQSKNETQTVFGKETKRAIMVTTVF